MSSLLPTVEEAPCWAENQSVPLAVANWISQLTWVRRRSIKRPSVRRARVVSSVGPTVEQSACLPGISSGALAVTDCILKGTWVCDMSIGLPCARRAQAAHRHRGCRGHLVVGQISRLPPRSGNVGGPRVAPASRPAFQERVREQIRACAAPRAVSGPAAACDWALRFGWRRRGATAGRGVPSPRCQSVRGCSFFCAAPAILGSAISAQNCAARCAHARFFLSAAASRVAARLGRGPPPLRRASVALRGILSRRSRRGRSFWEAAALALSLFD